MFYLRPILVLICIASVAACSPKGSAPAPTGLATLEATARAPGLNFECTGTSCECDATAPIDSTRTCVGMLRVCRDRGAEDITCKINGAMTCVCEFSVPD